ncbi:hypothetical protein C8F04DRAFT_129401 [Mycena alexandri]|uniref:Uncharacterized protein n=1 Tax=Mycena alexandri TaxID=1745969 RepID=A0AAD6TAY0_9AGAR|nr:hypothetical protein C8F04DRAFT_129401 [Mycena alexandri]
MDSNPFISDIGVLTGDPASPTFWDLFFADFNVNFNLYPDPDDVQKSNALAISNTSNCVHRSSVTAERRRKSRGCAPIANFISGLSPSSVPLVSPFPHRPLGVVYTLHSRTHARAVGSTRKRDTRRCLLRGRGGDAPAHAERMRAAASRCLA